MPPGALIVLLAACFVRAQGPGEILRRAAESADAAPIAAVRAGPNCRQGIQVRRAHQFCDDVDECQTFCACACAFDPHGWVRNVTESGVECPNAPDTGEGLLAPDSQDLLPLDARFEPGGARARAGFAFRHVVGAGGHRAVRAVVEGLQRLDDWLAASEERRRLGARVRVKSCYRAPQSEVSKDCGLILKARHVLAKPDLKPADREYWTARLDPNQFGRAWPGATPHTAGHACDLVLEDPAGSPCFDWRAGVADAPTCSIEQRAASRLMDEAATNDAVGGRRLDFEAWHFEWDTDSGSRCRHPDCADRHWPPTGSP